MFTRGKGHLVFLDEGCDVAVADNGAFPFLHSEYTVINLDLKVALNLALASQTPMFLDFLT